MIMETLFYISGIIFFASFTFIIWYTSYKYYKIFYCTKMTSEQPNITYPEMEEPNNTELDKYKLRLIQAHVKTADDLQNMSSKEIKKIYLKHEQSIIDKMSKQVFTLFVKGYSKTMSNVLPIDDENKLEQSLCDDVFLQAAINEYFPGLYYKYGAFLAPLSVTATTAAHVDYTKVKEKFFPIINVSEQSGEESQESERGDNITNNG